MFNGLKQDFKLLKNDFKQNINDIQKDIHAFKNLKEKQQESTNNGLNQKFDELLKQQESTSNSLNQKFDELLNKINEENNNKLDDFLKQKQESAKICTYNPVQEEEENQLNFNQVIQDFSLKKEKFDYKPVISTLL